MTSYSALAIKAYSIEPADETIVDLSLFLEDLQNSGTKQLLQWHESDIHAVYLQVPMTGRAHTPPVRTDD